MVENNAVAVANKAIALIESLRDRVVQRDAQIETYNSNGFADADALAEKYMDLYSAFEQIRSIAEKWNYTPDYSAMSAMQAIVKLLEKR